jgi:hypothetical protein
LNDFVGRVASPLVPDDDVRYANAVAGNAGSTAADAWGLRNVLGQHIHQKTL